MVKKRTRTKRESNNWKQVNKKKLKLILKAKLLIFRNNNKNIQEQLELIRFDLEQELYDKFSLQFESELNKKLNDVIKSQ